MPDCQVLIGASAGCICLFRLEAPVASGSTSAARVLGLWGVAHRLLGAPAFTEAAT